MAIIYAWSWLREEKEKKHPINTDEGAEVGDLV